MGEATTFVGIDAHKSELQLAMVIGDATQPRSWTSPHGRHARLNACAGSSSARPRALSSAAMKPGRPAMGCSDGSTAGGSGVA